MHCNKKCADKLQLDDSPAQKESKSNEDKKPRPHVTYITVTCALPLFDKHFQMDVGLAEIVKVYNYFEVYFGPMQSLLLEKNRTKEQNNALKAYIEILKKIRRDDEETLLKSSALFELPIPELPMDA